MQNVIGASILVCLIAIAAREMRPEKFLDMQAGIEPEED
jgi:hypothetical protein